ncbi:MAG: TSUP family transporter [Magnetospiraceae bacterium]
MSFDLGGETFGILGGAVIAAIFFLAGVVKGAAAFGVPTVSMPFLVLLMPVPTAASLLVVPILVSNLVQGFQMRHGAPILKRIWPLLVVLPIMLFFSSHMINVVDSDILFALVGSLIVLLVILQLANRIPPVPTGWTTPLLAGSGMVAGLLGGVTSFYAFPSLQLFLALRLAQAEFVFAACSMFIVGALALGAGYTDLGLLSQGDAFLMSFLVIPPLLAGQQLGLWLVRRGSADRFKKIALAVLFLLGLSMVVRGVI